MTENEEKDTNKGVALIKPEFLVTDHVPVLALGCVSNKDKTKLTAEETPQTVPASGAKKVLKGQNKVRGPTFRQDRESTLCPRLVDVKENEDLPVCTNEKCTFLHDISAYLNSKPPDIKDECYVFTERGYCPRGVTCRFGKSHLTENGRNIMKIDAGDGVESTRNFLGKELQHNLRKKKYDFSKSERILAVNDGRKKVRVESTPQGADAENPGDAKTEQPLGSCDDSDLIRLRREEKKKINWKDKLLLAPLTTVGNLPFRRICKEFGADITCGEMTLASELLQGSQAEWALVRRHRCEDVFGVQICGSNPYVMTKCSQLLQENAEIDFVDINLGCPLDMVYQQGAGSGLLRRERILKNILICMNDVLDIPVTIKTRTGIYKDANVVHTLIPDFVKSGASMISIHGRTREQRYSRLPDWDYIEKCAELSETVPVFGNGDILSYVDYYEKLEKYPHISGVSVARGALYKPWIFTEIKERRHWDISSSERLEIIKKYTNYGLEQWGSDNRGIENTRKFLLEWLSFLHRYIPVGLLERPPQRINHRPPVYKGRDDLETLFASPNCQDWVKISEMLLGPVPEGFHFLPKHKANSWK